MTGITRFSHTPDEVVSVIYSQALTNGLGWGLAIGVLLVAIIAWKETRLARKEARDTANVSRGA